jgi:hypothetical protein
MDTDMVRRIDTPETDPRVFAATTLDALEADRAEGHGRRTLTDGEELRFRRPGLLHQSTDPGSIDQFVIGGYLGRIAALGESRMRYGPPGKAPRPWIKTTGRIGSDCHVARRELGEK